jgi:hypothetical protein
MKFTKHAEVRFRQRGFSNFILDIISAYGRVENAPGGATKIFLGKKEAQGILQEIKGFMKMVNKASGGVLILKDNSVITVYKRG